MKFLLYAIRMLLGALFVWSGLAKLRQPYEFLSAVYAYQLVSPLVGVVIAAILPWLELLLGGCLLAGMIPEGSLLTAAGVCSVFTFAVTVDWYRGLAISCGCFGASAETISGYSVARSWALLLVSLTGLKIAWASRPTKRRIVASRRKKDLRRWDRSRFSVPDACVPSSLSESETRPGRHAPGRRVA